MNRLLLATTNPGKLAELSRILKDVPATLVSLRDLAITDPVNETGSTFEENALLKARFYHGISGLPTIADDGGFEIDALNGEPGVKSHRWPYGDREATDEELIAYTFSRMARIPEGRRGAQLRVVVAFVARGISRTAEASVRGIVPMEPSGRREPGFPYRSILYIPEIGKFYQHEALTAAENQRYNHRRKAIEILKSDILDYLTTDAGRIK